MSVIREKTFRTRSVDAAASQCPYPENGGMTLQKKAIRKVPELEKQMGASGACTT